MKNAKWHIKTSQQSENLVTSPELRLNLVAYPLLIPGVDLSWKYVLISMA